MYIHICNVLYIVCEFCDMVYSLHVSNYIDRWLLCRQMDVKTWKGACNVDKLEDKLDRLIRFHKCIRKAVDIVIPMLLGMLTAPIVMFILNKMNHFGWCITTVVSVCVLSLALSNIIPHYINKLLFMVYKRQLSTMISEHFKKPTMEELGIYSSDSSIYD